jgi:hypothetical protein
VPPTYPYHPDPDEYADLFDDADDQQLQDDTDDDAATNDSDVDIDGDEQQEERINGQFAAPGTLHVVALCTSSCCTCTLYCDVQC